MTDEEGILAEETLLNENKHNANEPFRIMIEPGAGAGCWG